MRIFIGYHYGPSDAWVKSHVYRLVKAFGDEIESGELLYSAANLAQGVIDKIEKCDALIGVASRRDPMPNGLYTTHPWVRDELAVARAKNKLFVQVRETGLDPAQGILEGTQYIEYDRADLAECLVKLAEALGQWHLLNNISPYNISPYLLPTEFALAVTPLLDQKGFQCDFRIVDEDGEVKSQGKVIPHTTPGALRVMLRGVPRGHFIELEANYGAKRWISDRVSVESPIIIMNSRNGE